MIESIKELRVKCQKPRYKEVGNWMARHIVRDLALYVTWGVLHTSITANQVTLISIFVGLLAASAFMIPNAGGFLAGAIILQIWYLLDHVDGQVARYRGSASLTGVFFDYISHYLVHSFLFLGLALGAYFATGEIGMLLLGFIAALFMAFLSMFYDAKWKAFYHWFGLTNIQVGAGLAPAQGRPQGSPLPKRIFIFLCKLTEIHVIMNILTAFALLGLWLTWVPFAEIITVFYALLLPLVFSVRVAHAVKNRTLENV